MIFKCVVGCSVLLLAGCSPILFLGAGSLAGGYIAGRDKHITKSVSDTAIDAKIHDKLQKYNDFFKNVSVVTDNDCVLLTGTVKSEDLISQAEQIAWSVKGVKVVDNNITVGEKLWKQSIRDTAITSSCRTKLLGKSDIKSLNVKIKTCNNVVYLSGTARSELELMRIIDVVRNVKHVKKIVSYISLENGQK